MEQVAADLPMELIFSQVSIPRGRGKIERFFRSVDQLLLQDTPGYAPKGSTGVKAILTLPVFEQRFRAWLLEDYHHRVHVETKCKPAERWEAGGFVPRTPKSLEQLDLLLLTVAKTRRVQQDGIRFQGYRYMEPNAGRLCQRRGRDPLRSGRHGRNPGISPGSLCLSCHLSGTGRIDHQLKRDRKGKV